MGRKVEPMPLSETTRKAIVFELEKASRIYERTPGLRASTRAYQIRKLLRKLERKGND